MSKRRLTAKQKLKFLGFAVIPTVLLCYQLSIKRTVEEYRRYQIGVKEAAQIRAATPPAELAATQTSVEALYHRYSLDTLSADRNLLAVVSHFCDSTNLRLKDYRNVSLVQDDSMRVLTRLITIEGRFIPGIKMLYDLETKKEAGRVSSVAFTTVTDRQDKSTRLDYTLYVQNLIP
jgi:hypothetical protein